MSQITHCSKCNEKHYSFVAAILCCKKYECQYCGEQYEMKAEAETCCYQCPECNETWDSQALAASCCEMFICSECDAEYTEEQIAEDCCTEESDSSVASMGKSEQAPWVGRGHEISSTKNNDSYFEAVKHWGLETLFSPSEEAAGFYLLEIITNDLYQASGERRKFITPETVYGLITMLGLEVDEIVAISKQMNLSTFDQVIFDASLYMVQRIMHIEPMLNSYCQMAIGGELRHHKAVGGVVIDPPSRRAAAWKAWKGIVEDVGPEIFTDAAQLFREFGGSSYGGNKWAVPCEIVRMRLDGDLGPTEFQNMKLFVDRVWTLEHNGGCFLNKLDWPNNGLNNIKAVLNAHASKPENVSYLFDSAGSEAQKLFARYMKIAKETSTMTIPDFDPEFGMKEFTVCGHCHGLKEKGHFAFCHSIKNGNAMYSTHNGAWFKKNHTLLARLMAAPHNYFYDLEGNMINPDQKIKGEVWAHQFHGTTGKVARTQVKYNGKASGLLGALQKHKPKMEGESNWDIGADFKLVGLDNGFNMLSVYHSAYQINIANLKELTLQDGMRII